MDNLIDRMGYRSHFLHQIVAKPQNLGHQKQGCSLFYTLALYCEKTAKNDHFHEGGKVGRSNASLIEFFSVDSYDLKSMSFKFSNDIFITFEMPRLSFLMSIGKMNILSLFHPSASEVFG
jgi:hypothetical protein